MRSLGTTALLLACCLPAVAQEQHQKPILVLNAGGHTAAAFRVLFTPDGQQLISHSPQDKTIRLWDVKTGEALGVFRLPLGPGTEGCIHDIALSPDGRLLAAAV